jgi:acyl-coenzyme A synthetase/AMP-(fatty) acid ligase
MRKSPRSTATWPSSPPTAARRQVEEKIYDYKPVHIHFTTGRTAKSTPFVYSKRDLENIREGGYRLLNVFGLKEDDMFVNAFPYSPHLAFWQAFFAAEMSGFATLNSGGGKVMGTQNLIEAVEELKATVMCFIPGYAYYFLREAARQKRDFSSVRTILFGGERVPPGLEGQRSNPSSWRWGLRKSWSWPPTPAPKAGWPGESAPRKPPSATTSTPTWRSSRW